MKIKTAELTGLALDSVVATLQGWIRYPSDSIENGTIWHRDRSKAPFGEIIFCADWTPSTCWSQGGPIIEREFISILPVESGGWTAAIGELWSPNDDGWVSDTPLEAAMRCYVAGKLGDEVEIPEALVHGE